MTNRFKSYLVLLPYLGLIAALVVSAWSFVRSDQYRRDTDTILTQTYEIQWRVTQVRERLIRVDGYVRLAGATGDLDPDIDRQVALIGVNTEQLLALTYVGRFLPAHEIQQLETVQDVVSEKVAPAIASSDYHVALGYTDELQQRMFEVSSATVNHSSTLHETAMIDIAAERNRFIFTIALGLVIIGYLMIYQRNIVDRRQDQHIRWFSSLFAHMTRKRISALRHFLDSSGDSAPTPLVLEAAREAATELETINEELLKLSYSMRDPDKANLADVLNRLSAIHTCVSLEVCPSTKDIRVPATQFYLLVEELARNANAAISGKEDGRITIRTRLKRNHVMPRRGLRLDVIDNGSGMKPDVLEKAMVPLFSTKAGKHVGLGLAACRQLVTTMKGKMSIRSVAGSGTEVELTFSLALSGSGVSEIAL